MTKSKYRVKLISRGSVNDQNSRYAGQLPKDQIYGSCEFTFDAPDREYDWLVVIDDVAHSISHRIENLACQNEHTILVTTEPSSITKYGNAFAGQFNYLLTNQDENALKHPNAIRSQTGNVWFYGKSYDEIIATPPPAKTKKISTVCSSKQEGHTLHRLRFEFTRLLQEQIGEVVRFGHGYKWIDIKADALDAYEFHVAIENHYAPHVWTEKLADAFLGYCVPIYYGCPNVYDYFPEESLILIDLDDFEGSIKKIREIINTPGEYQRRFEAIKEARRRVIEEYNLIAMINKIVENHHSNSKVHATNKGVIYNRKLMRVRNPHDFMRFACWKIGNFVRSFVSHRR